MTLLLEGVTVLLLTIFTACDTSLSNVTLTFIDKCQVEETPNYWTDQINTDHKLSQEEVESYLDSIMEFTVCVIHNAADEPDLRPFANDLLNVTETLVSTLVTDTDTYTNIGFSVQNLEVCISMIGPYINSTDILSLTTSYASLDIDLVGISQDGSAAVVFMCYTNLKDIFEPFFFDKNIISNKQLMSAVVSFSLPKTTNTWILEVIDFTLEHIQEVDPRAILSCMNWETMNNQWSSCFVSYTTSTHTVCSCYYGTTFALISETDPCTVDSTDYCEENFLFRMLDYIFSINQLSQEIVEYYLITTMNLTEYVKKKSMSVYYGELLLYVNERLVSALSMETDTYNFTSISLQTLEVKVFTVGPHANLTETLTLTTSHACLDIDLIEISKNSDGHASVAFMSYTNIADILKPTLPNVNITIMSTVVSTTCPDSSDLYLTKPVNFTLGHIGGIDLEGILFCAYLDWYMWDTSFCTVKQTNSTHTVCFCSSCPETLALFVLTIPCMDNFTALCAKNFLDQIRYNTAQGLPQELVEHYLNIISNLKTRVKNVVSEQNELISFGNSILEVIESLVSNMVVNTNTSISVQNVEIQVFMVGANVNLSKITLITSHASLDIDLSWISENNQDSSPVAFMSYSNMSDIFKPTFFNTIINTKKTIMSTVVNVSLPQTTENTQLTIPVNFTFKHISELESEFSLSCVYWNKTQWVEDGCVILQTNSSHTVCSCNFLATFALIMETDPCRGNLTVPCINNFLIQIQYELPEELPQEVVERYLNMTINLMNQVKNSDNFTDNLTNYGNAVLGVLDNLVSTLVTKSDTHNNINISLQNLEVQVDMVVDPSTSLSNSLSRLVISSASMDIDLIGLSKNNEGFAAAALLSYTDLADILKPSLFSTAATTKTMMSTVVSATLPKTTHTWLTQPVNITFKHNRELYAEDKPFCVYWVETGWVENGCDTHTNSTHTVCSCDHLSVFAVIMETRPCKTLFGATVALHCNLVLDMSFAQGVGIVFLILCLLTFAFCCQNPNETNTALVNLCLNLLLFHLLDLLKPLSLLHLQPPQACAVVNGVRWFFFISAFVWMFIETVLLFLFIKKVSQIRSNQREGINWKFLNMFGYLIPLAVVIVCALVIPHNSINPECWGTDAIFDIPILVTVASNMILYIIIITMIIFTLKRLKNENLHRRNTDNTDVIIRVMFKSLAQFIILGCYWILLYIPRDDGVLYNVFFFLNSQQGTFIFIVHCLLNQEVRQQYKKFLCDICCFTNLGTTTEVEMTQETQH